jgi:ABC-type branched-subunit amino acid transport system substrate-binding protein
VRVSRFFVLLALVLFSTGVFAGEPEMIAGHSKEHALRLGEEMYQKGVLPSGAPLKATVQGDIEITGAMTTCSNCHLRSGLGSIEGGVLTPPTSGSKLYAPLSEPKDIPGSPMKRSNYKSSRPAYNDTTLANALLNGIGPSGNRMIDTMPRYLLDDDSMKILIAYLKNLSSKASAGVTENEIRFATIVSRDISVSDRNALLEPLNAYFRDDWNIRLYNQLKQKVAKDYTGSAGQAVINPYRKATLDVWELSGPPDTWSGQLEEYYRKKPVFAILGGVVSGSWAPVHRFSEKNRVPCIFPDTDLPVISENDWYTLYFSKGYYQEGETAAKYLSRVLDLPKNKKIIQIYRTGEQGMALAQGFTDTWEKLGNSSLTKMILPASKKTGKAFWSNLARKFPNSVLLVWLGPADLAGIDSLASVGKRHPAVFVSSTMLAGELSSIPDSVRDFALITYPTRLPDEDVYPRSLVTNWYKYKNIPVTNLKISANTFLITNLLSKVLIEMGGDMYRDYFLDIWDGGKDETNGSATYPVLSFGPGQRYASKGCYVVSLTAGQNPKVVRQSEWIIY